MAGGLPFLGSSASPVLPTLLRKAQLAPLSVEAYTSTQVFFCPSESSRRRSADTNSVLETRTLEDITDRVVSGSPVIHDRNWNVLPPSVVRAQNDRSWKLPAFTSGRFADIKNRASRGPSTK